MTGAPGAGTAGTAETAGTASPRHLSAATLARAREVVALYPEARSALIPLCHLAQAEEGWLTPGAMDDIAALLGVDPAEVLGTASFYDMLKTEPVGRYLVAVCTNIACLLEGAVELLEHAEASLGVGVGGTTADGAITLEEAECLADCDRAPCVQVNHRFVGAQTPESFDRLVEELRAGGRDGEVPRHGVLNRVERSAGLAAERDRVAAERAAATRAREQRAADRRDAASSGRSGRSGSSGSSGP